jgi:hypothetical protein
MFAVVMGGVAEQPAGTSGDRHRGLGGDVRRLEKVRPTGHCPDDQVLEAALAGVAGHRGTKLPQVIQHP